MRNDIESDIHALQSLAAAQLEMASSSAGSTRRRPTAVTTPSTRLSGRGCRLTTSRASWSRRAATCLLTLIQATTAVPTAATAQTTTASPGLCNRLTKTRTNRLSASGTKNRVTQLPFLQCWNVSRHELTVEAPLGDDILYQRQLDDVGKSPDWVVFCP